MTEDARFSFSQRIFVTLVLACCAIFALAVFREVLPFSPWDEEEESLPQLQNRLAAERSSLRQKLQQELAGWEEKNRLLKIEIARIEGVTP